MRASHSTPFCNHDHIITVVQILLHLSGDSHLNLGPTERTNRKVLSVIHINARSLLKKIDLIASEIKDYDIITMSETWLNGDIGNDKIHIRY